MSTTFLTSGTSWTVPADWNSGNNSIEVIAAGGTGGVNGRSGAGGGAYSKIVNLTLTPSANITYQVGVSAAWAGNNNQAIAKNTWFNGTVLADSSVGARGGQDGGDATAAVGGDTASGVGTTKYKGGDGGARATNGGGGGGGAGGPNGAGVNGVAASGDNGGDGGAGDNGSGGAGGTTHAPGADGVAGTEWDATHGSGGGGAGGNNLQDGGAGGGYGAGGGGVGSSGTAVKTGSAGLIVITYTVPTTLNNGYSYFM